MQKCDGEGERIDRDYIKHGDCLELMNELPDKSIDMVLCDLPYGTTACKWDSPLPMELLWDQYRRIIKPNGIICLFGKEPFTSKLIVSNISMFRYKMIWEKDSPTGFLNCRYRPLSLFEDILIFSYATIGSRSKNPIRYFPQGIVRINKEKRNRPNSTWRRNKGYNGNKNILNSDKKYLQNYTNYPKDILRFDRDKKAVHPTQKPVELLEYLIRTYSQEGGLILDNCIGSGSTAVACIQSRRHYIGYELCGEYFCMAKERIEKCEAEWKEII